MALFQPDNHAAKIRTPTPLRSIPHLIQKRHHPLYTLPSTMDPSLTQAHRSCTETDHRINSRAEPGKSQGSNTDAEITGATTRGDTLG